MRRAVVNKDGVPVVLTEEEELEAIRAAVLAALEPDALRPEPSLHSVLETVELLLARYESMANCIAQIERATGRCVFVRRIPI
jgi:hypothetical protein